ncbi:Glycosyltransferase involved in cell wall bisynthesis [Paenibacillus uliginis N3/975]|uniref:Glycosyltransferase involved in cell wall bisynthesis n=1 Tax=Paenibacillus uliginis N3/975 TaxID=1313296 RepID=A0A1X7HU78_9BACL|nr:glycosyltransferase family 4 protein [Paenibacillus uliginis]SMF92146.1 Glycosyltransferase involved in cell wall bisynthesis [Paenibacillus uliginis N3/975]
MKPKIVFVINYFYPDYASTGQLLTELCLHIQHDFQITVIAAQPEEALMRDHTKKRFMHDKLENIDIIRIRLPKQNKRNKWSRLRYIAAYFFYANLSVLKQKDIQILYTISTPPILGGLIGSIGKFFKRAKHIYNIQDFNPEQAEAVSYMKYKSLYRVARWLDTINCKYADHIITVGHDMQETLYKRFANQAITDSTVINNWTDEQEIVPLTKDHPKVHEFIKCNGWENKFIVMYSGNMGLYYDLENLIKIAEDLSNYDDIVFAFIGDGAVKSEMETYVRQNQLSNVFFLPFQPKAEIKYTLNAADVHLVVNQKGIKGVSVPSKIYGVMAAGKPILGVLEKGSEACLLIEHSGCGIVAEPQNYSVIVEELKSLYELDRNLLTSKGIQGREYLERHLRKEQSLDKYRTLLISI